MIRLQGRGATYGEIWYDEAPLCSPGVDILQYRQGASPIAGVRPTPFLSLVSNLAVAEAAIMETFGKDCRYKIRRAESRDRLRLDWVAEPADRLDQFQTFFDAFARQKSLAPCDRKWMAAAASAGQLVLSSASCDGETLVWHAHVVSGKTAGLQYSASCFRGRDNDYRALVGRANRWLHWQDMLALRAAGKERYDWGGLFEDESAPERAGINNFKRDFGGKPERTYHSSVPVTVTGRLWLPLREAWKNRWRPVSASPELAG